MNTTETTQAADFYVYERVADGRVMVAKAMVEPTIEGGAIAMKVMRGVISDAAYQALDDSELTINSLILDVTGKFVASSSTLMNILSLKNRIRKRGGTFAVYPLESYLAQLIRVLHLDHLVFFCDTLAQALAYCRVDQFRIRTSKETTDLHAIINNDKYIDEELEITDRILRLPDSEPPPRIASVPDRRPEYLAALLAAMPKDAGYGVLADRLEEETRTFRQQVAATLLPGLKDEMRRQPHGTYDQKVELVRWVNAELERFGMAFRHPKTGEAARFLAQPGNHPEIGSLELRGKDADGRTKTFTTPDLETLLSKLELMDAPARRESLSEWQATVGRQRRGARRG